MERMEHNCELEIICTTQSRSLARETQISQICGMQRGPTDFAMKTNRGMTVWGKIKP